MRAVSYAVGGKYPGQPISGLNCLTVAETPLHAFPSGLFGFGTFNPKDGQTQSDRRGWITL